MPLIKPIAHAIDSAGRSERILGRTRAICVCQLRDQPNGRSRVAETRKGVWRTPLTLFKTAAIEDRRCAAVAHDELRRSLPKEVRRLQGRTAGSNGAEVAEVTSGTVACGTRAVGSPHHGIQVGRAVPYGHGKVPDMHRKRRTDVAAAVMPVSRCGSGHV